MVRNNNNNNNKVNRKRIYFLFILFLAAFFLIIYSLVYIQYLNASEYKNYAKYQHTGELTIISKRGKILDRNGVELAVSLNEKTVYANPKLVVDSEYEAGVLAEILEMDEDKIKEKLDNKELGFVYIQRKISTEKAEEVSGHNLPGIYIQDESRRYYPLNDIAASVIGFTGIDNNGLSGIELQCEKILRGVDIKVTTEKDVFGNVIPVGDSYYDEKPINGKDVVLTIDSQIQYVVQKKLEELASEYNARRAICIVMNPENGEIYSMASYPGFDLNYYNEADPELYKIQGISFTYEPGSTFKIVNVSTALENNTVSKSQSFNLPPSIKVGDRVIKEISRAYNVTYTTEEIIKYSSNVGAVTIALSMGEKKFWEGIKKFGFGETTGIELPGEEKGLFYDYKTWPASTIGALAIGQSISVTPLQLLRAACAIANGGYLITPSIVKEVELLENEGKDEQLDNGNRVISKETADSVKDMMLAVVEGGTGTAAQIEGVEVCGKTGTAEKANKNGAGYSEGRQIVSFVGFAPYENPQVAVIVVVDEPQSGKVGIWGGTIAAPAFRDIMDFCLKRLKIY
jgi:stage V sporulation protein D (sporulation-specific penicillin-binding protein)